MKVFAVWDRPTRLFHWINFLCVLGLIGIGTAILFAGDLGASNDGKIALKTAHVWVGYVFVVNLLGRLLWAFIGGPHARWSALLPGGRGYLRSLREHLVPTSKADRKTYVGHNPAGRLAVSIILLALVVQACSGLILAGTDLYKPPFGGYIAEWVAGADLDPSQVRPYAPETVDEAAYKEMRNFRAPIIEIHVLTFYLLLALIVLHIGAVILSELRDGGTLVSAMFTGKKHFPSGSDPVDERLDPDADRNT